MTIIVTQGDCVEVLRARTGPLFDACVCDPPYHLTSIVERFGKPGAAEAQFGTDGAFARASRGFMGKEWDGGDVAFRPETWRAVYDQLKPGAHLVAFSGTRTYHRMACAIEDAGFEIRDQLAWVYGSGFPKSLDVSKAIDKRGGNSHLTAEIGAAIKAARQARGITKREADLRYCGGVTLWSWYEGRPAGQQMPTGAVMAAIARDWPELSDYAAMIAEAEREVVGQAEGTQLAVAPGQGEDRSAKSIDLTRPSTSAAAEWAGWGTALKPAWEPICLARKPLIGTVAANVLAHGTGGLNIDACRVEHGETLSAPRSDPANRVGDVGRAMQARGDADRNAQAQAESIARTNALGRFPANLLHDGSDEVVAMFPDTKSGMFLPHHRAAGDAQLGTFDIRDRMGEEHPTYGDSGSAARFFYGAKAGPLDRLGTEHPTVKPVDVMRWVARLVTRPGGLILDPFAGSGTTGIAALAEGFSCEMIDIEADHVADIETKLAHLRGEGGRIVERHLKRKAARAKSGSGGTLL